MHPADINAALQKVGSSQAQVARSLPGRDGAELTHAAVHLVIRGRSHSARIALRISEVTGLTVGELWPGVYPQLEAQQARTARARRTTPTTHRKAA